MLISKRKERQGFAQLDFRFRDEQGGPVNDYVITLGAIVNGVARPSNTVAHTHKNKITPSHFMVFINLKELEPHLVYFIKLIADSNSDLFSFQPKVLNIPAPANSITNIITVDQTTQIDVILSRDPGKNLFIFHKGDDDALHVKWNRDGVITDTNMKVM